MIAVLVGFMLLRACSGGDGGGFGDLIASAPLDGVGSVDPNFDAMEEVDQTTDEDEAFMEAIVSDLNGYWDDVFSEAGFEYEPVYTVLFSGGTQSDCGGATSAIGPHYCPLADAASGNRFMYIDLSFFDQMERDMGAPGDFARAYVIAHEAGHHIQTLTGTSAEVRQRSAQDSSIANNLSVRQELQADCYAGAGAVGLVEQDFLGAGDETKAINAAAAVGDDRLMEQAGRTANPHNYTHGDSENRIKWFQIGMASGSPDDCDTFSVSDSDVGL